MYSLVKAKKLIESEERLLLNYGKHKSVRKRFRFSNLLQKIVLELWHNENNWPTSLNDPTKPYWKLIEHKSNISEHQSPENCAFLQTHIKKRSLKQIKRLIYKSGWVQNHVKFWMEKLAENVIRSQVQSESWFRIPNSTNNE